MLSTLITFIQKYGGVVLETDEGADTVIVDPDYPKAYDLQNAYYVHQQERYQRIRVEDTTFVRACIHARTFQHTPVIRYPMRGNHPGSVALLRRRALLVDDFPAASISPKRMRRISADIWQ